MDIIELLAMRKLDVKARIKLVRHQDKKFDLDEVYRKGYLEVYQAYQGGPIFHGCDYIVSFLGCESVRARFVGVYRVLANRPASEGPPLPKDFPGREAFDYEGYFYDLEFVPGFDDLKDRVVIAWGGARAWHQWLKKKEMVEVLPRGYVAEFPGYLEVYITFDQLTEIINNESANREWHRLLSAVAGVYLILDLDTGMLYVGSAYGEKGILGRWAVYASHPDGGNSKLVELLSQHGREHASKFRFSILHTLPKTLTKEQVIAWEGKFKRKLGSRAFGLNDN